jgi:hypothetical protein
VAQIYVELGLNITPTNQKAHRDPLDMHSIHLDDEKHF